MRQEELNSKTKVNDPFVREYFVNFLMVILIGKGQNNVCVFEKIFNLWKNGGGFGCVGQCFFGDIGIIPVAHCQMWILDKGFKGFRRAGNAENCCRDGINSVFLAILRSSVCKNNSNIINLSFIRLQHVSTLDPVPVPDVLHNTFSADILSIIDFRIDVSAVFQCFSNIAQKASG
ncbi:MAG: hypothetical protein PHH96_07780 [Smithellaceae bacterium]|nr:hypothetical protein [Smithellaceae bacterium]